MSYWLELNDLPCREPCFSQKDTEFFLPEQEERFPSVGPNKTSSRRLAAPLLVPICTQKLLAGVIRYWKILQTLPFQRICSLVVSIESCWIWLKSPGRWFERGGVCLKEEEGRRQIRGSRAERSWCAGGQDVTAEYSFILFDKVVKFLCSKNLLQFDMESPCK